MCLCAHECVCVRDCISHCTQSLWLSCKWCSINFWCYFVWVCTTTSNIVIGFVLNAWCWHLTYLSAKGLGKVLKFKSFLLLFVNHSMSDTFLWFGHISKLWLLAELAWWPWHFFSFYFLYSWNWWCPQRCQQLQETWPLFGTTIIFHSWTLLRSKSLKILIVFFKIYSLIKCLQDPWGLT